MDLLARLCHDSRSVLGWAEGTTNRSPLSDNEEHGNLGPVRRSMDRNWESMETWCSCWLVQKKINRKLDLRSLSDFKVTNHCYKNGCLLTIYNFSHFLFFFISLVGGHVTKMRLQTRQSFQRLSFSRELEVARYWLITRINMVRFQISLLSTDSLNDLYKMTLNLK